MTSIFPAPGELVFIDRGLPDWQVLAAGVREGVEVVLLDPARDGLLQIAEAVQGRSGFDAIHILSHGASGALVLGNAILDDRIVYNPTTGALYYDADGAGGAAAVQFAILGAATHPAIAAGDFAVV